MSGYQGVFNNFAQTMLDRGQANATIALTGTLN